MLAAAVTAAALRILDFSGGLVVSEAPSAAQLTTGGIAMGLRWHPTGATWLAASASGELGVDDTNPERVRQVSMFGVGVSAGLWSELSPAVAAYAGVGADWLAGDVSGVRLGPSLSLAVIVGRPWGHPMALEARVSYLGYQLEGVDDRPRGLAGGLFLTGTLFPEPPPRSR